MIEKRYSILCLFLAFFIAEIKAQVTFKSQTYFDPLPSIAISASDDVGQVMFDSRGMMWMATSSGILKYDGYSFTKMASNLKSPHMLPDNYVQCMVEDARQRLWIGTNDGVACLDLQSGSLKHYHSPAANQRIIYSLFAGKDGKIWMGTDGGLLSYDERVDKLVEQRFCRYSVKSMAEDKKGNLYIGTWSNGLYIYNKEKKSMRSVEGVGKNAYSLCLDEKDRLWVGSWDDGLRMITSPSNPKQMTVEKIKDTGNSRIYNIVEDPITHSIWACSKREVWVINPEFHVTSIHNDHACDYCYLATNQKGLMAVASNWDGISLFSTLTSPIHYQPIDNLSPISDLLTLDGKHFWLASKNMGLAIGDKLEDSRPYSSLIQRRNGDIWAGNMYYGISVFPVHGDKKILNAKNCDFLEEEGVTSLAEMNDGTVLVGQWAHIAVFLPNGKGYSIDLAQHLKPFYRGKATHITVDSKKRVWISTLTNGILLLTGDYHRKDKVKLKSYNLSNGKYPLAESTSCMEDKQHRIWAISKSGGLMLLDEQKDCFTPVGEKMGVWEDKLYALNMDQQGALWMSADNYLIRLSLDKHDTPTVKRFYVPADVTYVKFQENATSLWNGKMYFAGKNGIVDVNPAAFMHPSQQMKEQYKRSVVVTDLLLDGVPYMGLDSISRINISSVPPDYTRKIVIPSSVRKMEVIFSMLSYDSNKQRLYSYRLEGYANDWVLCGNGEHKAVFENLPWGTYRLHLRAMDNYGEWQEMDYTVQIKVLPPWWATWWAELLWLALLAAFVYTIILWYRHRMRIQNKLQIARIFTNITHEFLTPLSVISASVDVLKSQIPEESFAAMKRNVDRLNRLIRQVLEIDKSKNGRLKLLVHKGNLDKFIAQECENMRALANQKHISISYEPSQEQSFTTCFDYFDTDKMDKILYNLLSNAIKYSEENGQIWVYCHRTNDGNAVISVKDQGIGISPDKMGNLFSRFMDGDYRRMKTMGTGIGLSLTHDLVKLHHGKIACESEVGKGTTFVVTIPVNKSAYQSQEIEQESKTSNFTKDAEQLELMGKTNHIQYDKVWKQSLPSEKEYKILIVEDNVELLSLMRQVLETHFEVYTAKNGEQALRIVEKKPLDLVVSDVMMPVMNGIELTKRIKENPDFGQLPVVLLTAKTHDEDRNAAYQTGADEYLCKPFGMDALQLRILNILKNRERIRRKFMSQTEFDVEQQSYSSPDTLFMEKALACVHQHLSDSEYDRETFARDMCMSSSSLYKKLRALTGQNVSAFINSIKMKEACKMAKANPYMPVNEVYVLLGYSTPAYFTRLFKAEFGMTFKEYQEKVLNENK